MFMDFLKTQTPNGNFYVEGCRFNVIKQGMLYGEFFVFVFGHGLQI